MYALPAGTKDVIKHVLLFPDQPLGIILKATSPLPRQTHSRHPSPIPGRRHPRPSAPPTRPRPRPHLRALAADPGHRGTFPRSDAPSRAGAGRSAVASMAGARTLAGRREERRGVDGGRAHGGGAAHGDGGRRPSSLPAAAPGASAGSASLRRPQPRPERWGGVDDGGGEEEPPPSVAAPPPEGRPGRAESPGWSRGRFQARPRLPRRRPPRRRPLPRDLAPGAPPRPARRSQDPGLLPDGISCKDV